MCVWVFVCVVCVSGVEMLQLWLFISSLSVIEDGVLCDTLNTEHRTHISGERGPKIGTYRISRVCSVFRPLVAAVAVVLLNN